MAAYIIMDIEVIDAATYQKCIQPAADSVSQYGGRALARGGRAEHLEGDWEPHRIVIFEFSSLDQARRWLHSPEYAPARTVRQASARTRMIVVEGV